MEGNWCRALDLLYFQPPSLKCCLSWAVFTSYVCSDDQLLTDEWLVLSCRQYGISGWSVSKPSPWVRWHVQLLGRQPAQLASSWWYQLHIRLVITDTAHCNVMFVLLVVNTYTVMIARNCQIENDSDKLSFTICDALWLLDVWDALKRWSAYFTAWNEKHFTKDVHYNTTD